MHAYNWFVQGILSFLTVKSHFSSPYQLSYHTRPYVVKRAKPKIIIIIIIIKNKKDTISSTQSEKLNFNHEPFHYHLQLNTSPPSTFLLLPPFHWFLFPFTQSTNCELNDIQTQGNNNIPFLHALNILPTYLNFCTHYHFTTPPCYAFSLIFIFTFERGQKKVDPTFPPPLFQTSFLLASILSTTSTIQQKKKKRKRKTCI